MAAATAVAFSTPAGLASSSLYGQKLKIKPTRIVMRSKRAGLVSAKYGDKSVYFDLEDISNTTGNWDMYGSDAASPYNPLQSKFFQTFAGAFTKRGLLLQFILLGYAGAIAYAGANASPNLLPIKRGPQLPPQPGPRGKI